MADGVAEVEGLAQATLVRIFLYDALLDGYGASDPSGPIDFREVGKILHLLPLLEVGDERVFDDLRETGAQFSGREGLEKARIGPHGPGIAKETDAVLDAMKIDAELAAHGSIDLREECGGNLNEIHTALEGTGTKAAHITDDAAAEVEQAPVATGARPEELLPDVLTGAECLVLFTRRNVDVRYGKFLQVFLDQGQAVLLRMLVGKDGDTRKATRPEPGEVFGGDGADVEGLGVGWFDGLGV